MEAESESSTAYKSLLTKLPSGQEALLEAHGAIENHIKEVSQYVEVSEGSSDVSCTFALFF